MEDIIFDYLSSINKSTRGLMKVDILYVKFQKPVTYSTTYVAGVLAKFKELKE